MRLSRSTRQLLRTLRPGRGGCASKSRSSPVLDSLMIACGAGFFVVAILYVVACEKM
jgi:hypothetical protein